VPAKKTRPSGKAVYLLSADRKYRRLSLKKVSERVKAVRRRKRAPKAATAGESPKAVHRDLAPEKVATIAVVLAALILVASLVGASWDSSPAAEIQVAAAQPEVPAVLTADVASVPVVRAKPLTASPAVNAPRASNASPVPAAVTSTATLRRTEITETTKAQPSASAEAYPVAAATAAPVDTVTISGCLDFDGKSAWLKDSSGVDAPRTRSWRSGFLKKRSSRIALVDGPSSAAAYDGRLVSVTGVLVDREMRVSALRPIAGDCE